MRKLLAATALFASLLGPAAAQQADAETMEWPEPIAWGEPIPRARVAHALREALVNAKWQIEADSGLSLTARHEIGEHVLRVRLDYASQQVRYDYVDSRNYLYRHEDGQHYIHRRANRLMRKLDRQVHEQVRRMRLERRDHTEVVPVLPADAPSPD